MQRQNVGNIVRAIPRKTAEAAVTPTSRSRPVPLDAESLKKVAGGTTICDAPHKGW
jgi:hypothetical protein